MISKLLKNKRIELGLSPQEVSEKMGITRSALSKIESSESINEKTILRYCEAINVSVQDLWAGKPASSEFMAVVETRLEHGMIGKNAAEICQELGISQQILNIGDLQIFLSRIGFTIKLEDISGDLNKYLSEIQILINNVDKSNK